MADSVSFTFYNSSGGTWSIGLPFSGNATLRANIDWGDSTSSLNVSPATTHNYTGTGPFTAVYTFIAGQLYMFGSLDNNTTSKWLGAQYLTTVSTTNYNTWGMGTYITSFRFAFRNCTLLTSVPINIPTTVYDLYGLFYNTPAFNSPNINSWDVSYVLGMGLMFAYSAFNHNITGWNTGRVVDMGGMFTFSQFNQDIGGWDVGNVTNMTQMFTYASFNQNLNSWNTSNVLTMDYMFFGSSFNSPIGNWNVSKVTNMLRMFSNSEFNQDIGSWNVVSVTNMGSMFEGNLFFNQNIGHWNTSNVTSMGHLFYNAREFNQFIRCWNVSKVTSFDEMFYGSIAMFSKYNGTSGYGITPTAAFFGGLLGFTITTPTANTIFTIPFTTGTSISSLNIQWGDGTTTTDATSAHTYSSAGNYNIYISSINATINTFGPPNTTSAPCLTGIYSSSPTTWGLGSIVSSISFENASALVSVPLSIPNSVSSAASMFQGASTINDNNIRYWNMSNITNMTSMFENATSFDKNLNNWNVSKATNMSSMFRNATYFNNGGSSLTWQTNAVTNLSYMFYMAINFNQDIKTFNTANATNLTSMFQFASAFAQYIRGWVIGPATTLTNMFLGATAFVSEFYPTTPGYNTSQDTPLYTFFNIVSTRYPCFMEGTRILCFHKNKEIYRPIQELRKGDLVKTLLNGYLPIDMIGTSELKNPGHNERVTNRLYKYTTDKYPELFNDLYITGCHSILVPFLTDDEWDKTKELLGDIYITDNHYRLMACLDEKAEPYCKDAYINIYHIALENENYYMNYGVYANGLLVESCSKRYLTELSNMRILGEEERIMKEESIIKDSVFNTNIAVI